jgi:hypothetical protein
VERSSPVRARERVEDRRRGRAHVLRGWLAVDREKKGVNPMTGYENYNTS